MNVDGTSLIIGCGGTVYYLVKKYNIKEKGFCHAVVSRSKKRNI